MLFPVGADKIMNYGYKKRNVVLSDCHSGLPFGPCTLPLLCFYARDQLAAGSSQSRSKVSVQAALSEVIKIPKLWVLWDISRTAVRINPAGASLCLITLLIRLRFHLPDGAVSCKRSVFRQNRYQRAAPIAV